MFSVMETMQSVFQAVGGFVIGLELDQIGYSSDATWQARDTCLREAGAALQAARRGNLTSSEAERLDNNALQRCEVFKSDESHAACVARVRDAGSGSVPEGGLLRESTITTITPVPQ